MSERPNFSAYCEQACRKLWGEPTRTTSKELRWTNGGDAYSGKTFNLKKRVWYDHGAQAGGSTLELVSHSRGEPIKELRGAEFFEAWRKGHELGIIPNPPPARDSGKLKIRRTYPYQDANGELLYEVVRFDTEEKDDRFRQRRPDGRGGWIWKSGERQILYRLPELIEGISQDRPILLCEGERDADSARALGYIATTAPGGAEKPWRNEYSETLRRADVIVISDNDQHGRGQRHAEKVARTLSGGIARRVCIITFPVKDLSDWIAAGHAREELDSLIENAPEFDARICGNVTQGNHTAKSIKGMKFDPIKYVVHSIIVEGLTLLAAKPKAKKSWLMLHAAIAVARGGFTLGDIKCEEGDVLYCALEDNLRRLKSRLAKLLGMDADWPDRLQFKTEMPRLAAGGIEEIENWIKSANNPRLIVIDTLAMVRSPKKPNETPYEADYASVEALRKLANQYGVAIVVIHHMRKADSDDAFDTISGTLGLTGAVDTLLVLKRDASGNVVLHGRGRDVIEFEKALVWNEESCTWTVTGSASEARMSRDRRAILAVLGDAEATPSEIASMASLKPASVKHIVLRMLKDGLLTRSDKGKYAIAGDTGGDAEGDAVTFQ